jgi:hypothetical protein
MPEPTGYEDDSMDVIKRGYIDHLALRLEDEASLQMVGMRLFEVEASNGIISDFGAIRLLAFVDPDGMEG